MFSVFHCSGNSDEPIGKRCAQTITFFSYIQEEYEAAITKVFWEVFGHKLMLSFPRQKGWTSVSTYEFCWAEWGRKHIKDCTSEVASNVFPPALWMGEEILFQHLTQGPE